MGYLRLRDYEKQIQLQNLDQITSNDPGLVDLVNSLSQEEMTSYLIQKYNTAFEFTDTPIFKYTAVYGAADRFYLDFVPYNPLTSYIVGDTAEYALNGPNDQYVCIAPTTGAFNPVKWQTLGKKYTIAFISYPYPRFNYLNVYKIGDRVWWEGKVYQALRDTIIPTHEMILQARVYRNIGPPNSLPGAPQTAFADPNSISSSTAQWGVGTPFSIAAASGLQAIGGTLPWSSLTSYSTGNIVSFSDPTYPTVQAWVAVQANINVQPGSDIINWLPIGITVGDNRSQQMVALMADIALFHLHSRIAPRNIPELRVARYAEARKWLMDAAKGNVTPINLELNQPEIGNRITFGGNIKSINSY